MKSLLLLAFCFVVSLVDAQDLQQRYKAASDKTAMEACANIETYSFYPQTCNGVDFNEYVKKYFKPVVVADDWIKLNCLITFNCDGQTGNLKLEYDEDKMFLNNSPYTSATIDLFEQLANFVDTLHCVPNNKARTYIHLMYQPEQKKLTIN